MQSYALSLQPMSPNAIQQYQNIFFIGVAGTGMSAIAQYLQGIGKSVRGSDRYFKEGEPNETRSKLEAAGIQCFPQDGSGLNNTIDLVVTSTAVEATVPEVQLAQQLNIPILRRAEVLAMIAASKKTIAVGGTSGKSTTSAMIFDILTEAKLDPSIISGAGLTSIIQEGKIGNAHVGQGEWLIIEADESDGSIVHYHPEIGLLLNIDKDHQELEELMKIFGSFRDHSIRFITNAGQPLARSLSTHPDHDFSIDPNTKAAYKATDFSQTGFEIQFRVEGQLFSLATVGQHNMENALAAIAVTHSMGVHLHIAAKALKKYEGIYRRHQVLGHFEGVWLIDDYAHNPAKCAASIRACQPVAPKVVAWFQPHGYGPTRFLRNDFVKEIAAALRPEDEIWMSEIFYAGGTAVKNISAADLINDLKALEVNAYFVEDRNEWIESVQSHLQAPCVLLLMGARDPGLESFALKVKAALQQ